ncbi:MAG: hypothetical protein H6Q29_1508 [Bacteroidetes bacterium]|nr:hypothetical protein [Bacteroidota bacterium]
MKLRVQAFGLATGIVMGLFVFLLTLVSLWFGRGETIDALVVPFPGFSRSIGGAIVGLIWGFVDGFIGGALLAWLYNRFADKASASKS